MPALKRLDPSEREFRNWQDKSGQFSIEAEFISYGMGTVVLRKKSGGTLEVPMDKLSEDDQEWIRKRGR